MRNRTKAAIAFLLFALLFLVGCTAPHKINLQAIESNKDKIFALGMVKVSGCSPLGGEQQNKKKSALQRIPIEQICSVLTSNFNLKIDTRADGTVKVLEGWPRILPPICEDVYWGNKEYTHPGKFFGILKGDPEIKDGDQGNMIYITYWVTPDNKGIRLPWPLKETFWYDVEVKANATVLMHFSGPITVIDMPQHGIVIDFDGYWDQMVLHVDQIPEALERDVAKMKRN